MGWSIGYDSTWQRDIGYGVPATCDHHGCGARIDRGLSFVCGGEPYGGEHGCGLYFCDKHLFMHARRPQLCERCSNRKKPFTPTPDVYTWVHHKHTHPSWQEWRDEQEKVERALMGEDAEPMDELVEAQRAEAEAGEGVGTKKGEAIA